jgi:hypothetical protein
MLDFNIGRYLLTIISIGYPNILDNKIKMRSNSKGKERANNKHEEESNNKCKNEKQQQTWRKE